MYFTGRCYSRASFYLEKKSFKTDTRFRAYFELKTESPIPLGCTVTRQAFSDDLTVSIEKEIQKSIDLARSRKSLVTSFIKEKAQIEDDSVIEDHIRMFVTDFSYNMGKKGFEALKSLFSILKKK
jgi:1,4-dihydroxy-6-naphthoate synthase